jgi:hypothetical protein
MKVAVRLGILAAIFLLVSHGSWAQESGGLSITNTMVEPSTVSIGGMVLISCRVSHTSESTHIERVAATVFHGTWISTYPMLYDNGTNGDRIADDGIYSLEIDAPGSAGEARITFDAVDKDRNEIESEPIILTVK